MEEEQTDDPVQMVLNDSSEYSDELTAEENLTTSQYPFAEKAPEVREFLFFHLVFYVLIILSYFFYYLYLT